MSRFQRMTPAELRTELGRILAAGLIRMRAGKSSPLSADGRDSSVDLLLPKSVHAKREQGGMTE